MPIEGPPYVPSPLTGTIPTTTLRVVDVTTGLDLAAYSAYTPSRLIGLDLAYPDIRTVVTPKSGAHGTIDTTRWVGGRAITAVVRMPFQPDTDDAVDVLAGLINPENRYYLYIQRPTWTSERRILARGAGFACPPGQIRTAQAQWTGPAGILEEAAASTVTLVPSASAAGGITFPIAFPMTFDTGLVPGAALVSVSGNTAAIPTIDIFGPCSDPLIRCVDTGQQIVFTGLSIADGDYLRVDMGNRTAYLNADTDQSRYDRIDFTQSDWWTLPVGPAVQLVFSPTSPSGACQAVVTWRNRWL